VTEVTSYLENVTLDGGNCNEKEEMVDVGGDAKLYLDNIGLVTGCKVG